MSSVIKALYSIARYGSLILAAATFVLAIFTWRMAIHTKKSAQETAKLAQATEKMLANDLRKETKSDTPHIVLSLSDQHFGFLTDNISRGNLVISNIKLSNLSTVPALEININILVRKGNDSKSDSSGKIKPAFSESIYSLDWLLPGKEAIFDLLLSEEQYVLSGEKRWPYSAIDLLENGLIDNIEAQRFFILNYKSVHGRGIYTLSQIINKHGKYGLNYIGTFGEEIEISSILAIK